MQPLTDADIANWRSEFPILAESTYLNSCSLGPLSLRGMRYLEEFQGLWNTHGASAWYEIWLGRIDELRGVVAELFDANIDEVALVPSVSAGLASVSTAIDYSRRNRVIVSELDFPTLAHQWLGKPGVEVVQVPSPDGVGTALNAWEKEIDERTAVVATSHVLYSTGFIQDVRSIAELAHSAGALMLVDGYHAMGQMPVSPRQLGADFYLAGPLKWMLGGPGLAFLWVRNDLIEGLAPTTASWFSVEDQFDFRADRLTLRRDARRFAMGTPALPTVYTALAGAQIIREVGPARIRERIVELVAGFQRDLDDVGQSRLSMPAANQSGIVMVRDGSAAETVDALRKVGMIVDSRGDFIRVSPHFYNTASELKELAGLLRKVRAR